MTRVDPKLRYYPESRFGGYSDVDQLVTFYTRVRALIEPDFTVLDAGCGRGRHAEDQAPARRRLSNLQGTCARLIGIDVDPAARQNPFVDEFRLIDADRVWPVSDSSVDLIVSDYVLEHVVDPELFFSDYPEDHQTERVPLHSYDQRFQLLRTCRETHVDPLA